MPAMRLLSWSPPHFLDGLFVVGIFVAVGVAFALFGVCGGGISLALFGVAVAMLGFLLGRSNAWATIIPVAIVTLVLVGAGLYETYVGGCHF
jgi:hypothetical protein